MIRGLLGRKLGMTQIFDRDGNVIPVTVIQAGPCTVLRLIDGGRKKVALGFEPASERRIRRSERGFFLKIGVSPLRTIREFESEDNSGYAVGQELKADLFKAGDFVDVSGVSKGKGFQGGMKRWGWGGGPAGHGSMHHRRVGSIGASADPSRVFRGTHMPGHMGARKATVQGLRIMMVDAERNLILVKGGVPGARRGLVVILRSKKKAYRSLEEKRASVFKKRNPMKQSKAKAGAKAKRKK